MKWINASERLPEIGKSVIWKWGNITGIYIEYTDWIANSNGIYIRADNLINIENGGNEYYWLDETPIDWKEIESKFHAKYMEGVYNSYYMSTEVITKWFKEQIEK